jgi:hypothetical protein
MPEKCIIFKVIGSVKNSFINSVSIINLEKVTCLNAEENTPERVVKVAKCKQNSILTSIQNTYSLFIIIPIPLHT